MTHTTARTDKDISTPSEIPYVGRFAPAPTGPLHFGSMLAAFTSYLDAKHHNGEWRLRIDNLDAHRCRPEFNDLILFTLDKFGLHWDGEVVYQQQRTDAYTDAMNELAKQDMHYPCYCSRQQLPSNAPYPGTCLNLPFDTKSAHSIRVKVSEQTIRFNDHLQGDYQQNLQQFVGDFHIKRRDGIYSYHLATVVDDEYQNITYVVRGYDLLDSTPRQIYLQNLLSIKSPEYSHFPVAVNSMGNKFSKQNHAPDISQLNAKSVLAKCLEFLGQSYPNELDDMSVQELIQSATKHWNPEKIKKTESIVITETGDRIS